MSEPRTGVYICNCGTNIAKVVDCEAVTEAAAQLPGVVVARSYKYMCSNPGQEMIVQDIKDNNLERVVVAACSPRMHEPTFRRALETAGLNAYLLEMANIREQCSWVHDDPVQATEKAKELVRGAVARVAFQEPLERMSVDMCSNTLVIGGGIAGLTAALEMADAGNHVYLVEKQDHLGGNMARVDLTAPYLDSGRDMLFDRVTRASEHANIDVMLNSSVDSVEGFIGNFKAKLTNGAGKEEAVDVGSAIVCTGYNVITSFELEQMLRQGRIAKKDGSVPQSVAIVHCVGSRSKEFHGYCSRVCCMTALKYANEIKSALPKCSVADVYVDMHAFGKGCEDLYRRSSEAKTLFLMYAKGAHPSIKKADAKAGCEMLIEVNEQLSGEAIELPADLVVLMVGLEPQEDAKAMAHLMNISQDKDGWFIESHPKLDPVATTTEGVFIAGACQAPKDIPDSVAQARAAAARILAKIACGRLEIDAIYAEVNEDLCSGCRMCNEVCPYSAIEFDEEKRRSHVISALCKSCGACVATCPSSAIKARHFTDEQIFAEIAGVLG